MAAVVRLQKVEEDAQCIQDDLERIDELSGRLRRGHAVTR